eukprot:jgi/Tetstr1/443986/TSEL_031937.t1
MVKELREKTGVGMMDCKAALAENNGDMDAAVDWLRTKGLAKAAKKAGRVAAEGLVGVASDGTRAAVVELNSETDFVARNDAFQALIAGTSQAALAVNGDVEALADAPFPGRDKTVGDEIKEAIATIGENMSLRRAAALSVENGAVATYVHGAIADGMGKIGVLVALESTGDAEQVNALGRKIAMHVAATNPLSLDVASLDADVVERERQIFSEQARESGKPENIIEKMEFGIDPETVGRVAKEIAEAVSLGAQVGVVVGGGNIFRGVAVAAKGGNRVTGDHMGMLATVMNSLTLADALRRLGVPARVLSAVPVPSICETFTQRSAERYMEDGDVIVFAGGTGNPFFTTDSGAALRAAEMRCDAFLKGTSVDGVYSADPKKVPDAERYDSLTPGEVLGRDLKVMDATAIALARDNAIPVIVFSIRTPGALVDVMNGAGLYTVISD